MPTTPLIDTATYKSLMGVQVGDTRDDTRITALLPAASRAITSFTNRDFSVAGAPSTRTYLYDNSGFLDIDDCTNITALTTDAGISGQSFPMDAVTWMAMPQDDSDVFYYVLVTGGPYFGVSTEMGFTYNLDTIGLQTKSPTVNVTATWGWPAIPDDVKLATALTVSELMSGVSGEGDGLTAEAISGYSRSWGGRNQATPALVIPNRARDLLTNYQRVNV
jgi:hypothetical protein